MHAAAGYGFVGPRYARFAQSVRSPETVIDNLPSVGDGPERRYIGHNPVCDAMIIVLLAATAATAVSGWLRTTDTFWGWTVMQHGHSLIAHVALALVVLRLAGVALASLRHHENWSGQRLLA
jgi:cytochrome b